MNNQQNTLDRKDLKILALKEKLGQIVSDYEERIADLRVELTLTAQQVQEMSDKITELSEPDVQEEADNSEEPANDTD